MCVRYKLKYKFKFTFSEFTYLLFIQPAR